MNLKEHLLIFGIVIGVLYVMGVAISHIFPPINTNYVSSVDDECKVQPSEYVVNINTSDTVMVTKRTFSYTWRESGFTGDIHVLTPDSITIKIHCGEYEPINKNHKVK